MWAKIKSFFHQAYSMLRRWKKSHPWRLVLAGVVIVLLGVHGVVGYQHHQTQQKARDRIEALPQLSLQSLQNMANSGKVKQVVSHDIRSGSMFYPQDKSYLEIVNTRGQSYVWEKDKNNLLQDQFGKMLFSSSLKQPIVFKTGNVIVANAFSRVFLMFMVVVLLLAVLVFAQSMMAESVSGGKFKAQSPDEGVSLDDVVGYEDVKRQLRELKDQLLHAEKYQKRGVIAPKGILFTGDPGVGKTMMAKALANEIGADFFTCTGADFAEMYVGVGPKRVRSLFRQARQSGIAVVFIDEIDALGSRNTMGNDSERLGTLNAMLAEMDGVNMNGQLVVVGATNHPHLLDPALVRPGRFDYSVNIPLPDATTREGILRHYLGKEKTSHVDLRAMALRTHGYSGAQLRGIVLEAKRLAVREHGFDQDWSITQELLQRAQEIALLGISEVSSHGDDLLRVAVHELGHALSGYLLCPELYVEKVTTLGRGSALGYAVSRPIDEKRLSTKRQMEARLVHYLAGRAAEEVVLGDISGGASDDIQKANQLSRDMVLGYGMGEGARFSQNVDHHGLIQMSEESKKDIRELLDRAYQQARDICEQHQDWIKSRTEALMNKGVLMHEELFEGLPSPTFAPTDGEKWMQGVLVERAARQAHLQGGASLH